MNKLPIKLCICTFHNSLHPGVVGGVTTGPLYLRDMLNDFVEKVDVVSLRVVKSNKSTMFQDVISNDNPNILKLYDFVIFMSPGLTYEKPDSYDDPSTAYMNVLDNLECDFGFIINEENDRKLYPFYKNFLSHPRMKLLMFNSEGMNETFGDFLEYCPNYIIFNFSPKLDKIENILEKAKSKENILMSTARWTDRKRVLELALISKEFHDKGIKVKIAGAHQSPFYMIKMKQAYSEYWEDLGYYDPADLPTMLKPVKYHYNFVYLKRIIRSRIMVPRIEIATLEAFNEGCLPIICSDTTPDWVGSDSVIRIPKEDYNKLPEILANPELDSQIPDRMKKFYQLWFDNIYSNYSNIVNKINDIVF